MALIYPERKRCRTCRKFFGFELIDGLYCSGDCVPYPYQEVVVDELPRTCRTRDRNGGGGGGWRLKLVFPDEESARRAKKRYGSGCYYQCPNCHRWHLAKKPYQDYLPPAQSV